MLVPSRGCSPPTRNIDMACCSAHDAEDDMLAEELESLANDPTLASCCSRDLRDQAKHERLCSTLRSFDRTNARLNIHQQAIHSEQAQQDDLQKEQAGKLYNTGHS